jgi:hypothetical protein
MKMVRYITRHASLLNALLLVVFLVVAAFVFLSLTRTDLRYSLPQVKLKAPAENQKQVEKTASPTPADFTVIGEMNLFHPERITPIEKKAELPKPELILYATMVSDTAQFAFIEDKKSPKTTPGRGNRQTVIQKGDVISGFTVTEITTDKIVLAKGDEQFAVYISAGEKRKEGIAAPAKPGTAPAARPAPPARSPPTSPGRATPTPRPPGKARPSAPWPPASSCSARTGTTPSGCP